MYDAVIIGAGVAGLTSAIYLGRAGKKVLLLEAKTYGGQIVNAPHVSNYPGFKEISGFDLVQGMYEQAMQFGITFKTEEVLSIEEGKTIVTNKNRYETRSIIIATGLRKRPLGLYAETDLVGKGISYCATCDGNFYKNRDVAVVGGGNTALEDALYLSNIANKVYLIHRTNQFRGNTETFASLEDHENIIIYPNTQVVSLNGETSLTSITLLQEDKEQVLDVQGLFIAIGQIPDNLRFSNVVDLDEGGFILSDNCRTKHKNIFVAGDTRKKDVCQLVTAASDGAIAATLAIQFLNENKGI